MLSAASEADLAVPADLEVVPAVAVPGAVALAEAEVVGDEVDAAGAVVDLEEVVGEVGAEVQTPVDDFSASR